MKALFFVFVGSGLGGVFRYLIQKLFALFLASQVLPWATLFANVLACFMLGAMVSIDKPNVKLLLVTGFCGGLSTFSTFTYELFQLQNSFGYLLIYAVTSLVFCFLFLYLGQLLKANL